MPPPEKAGMLLVVQRKNSRLSSDSERVSIRGLQDAIDYIIHYNPLIVEVGSSMTDLEVAKLKSAVNPWFSGKILTNNEQHNATKTPFSR